MQRKIAMRCTQEQWDAIKDKLVNVNLITSFTHSNYLVNCYRDSCITNVPYEYASAWTKEVYKEWNEQVFLDACGIEKTFKGSELQYWSTSESKWIDCGGYKFRFKPDNTAEIQALENQIKELQDKLNKLK